MNVYVKIQVGDSIWNIDLLPISMEMRCPPSLYHPLRQSCCDEKSISLGLILALVRATLDVWSMLVPLHGKSIYFFP